MALDAERHWDLPMSMGKVTGFLLAKDTQEFLKENGCTDDEIEAAYKALVNLSKAFYKR